MNPPAIDFPLIHPQIVSMAGGFKVKGVYKNCNM